MSLFITDIETEQAWFKADNPIVNYSGYILSDNGAYIFRVTYKSKYPSTKDFYNWVFAKFKAKT